VSIALNQELHRLQLIVVALFKGEPILSEVVAGSLLVEHFHLLRENVVDLHLSVRLVAVLRLLVQFFQLRILVVGLLVRLSKLGDLLVELVHLA
jgi:hypothetical protein